MKSQQTITSQPKFFSIIFHGKSFQAHLHQAPSYSGYTFCCAIGTADCTHGGLPACIFPFSPHKVPMHNLPRLEMVCAPICQKLCGSFPIFLLTSTTLFFSPLHIARVPCNLHDNLLPIYWTLFLISPFFQISLISFFFFFLSLHSCIIWSRTPASYLRVVNVF